MKPHHGYFTIVCGMIANAESGRFVLRTDYERLAANYQQLKKDLQHTSRKNFELKRRIKKVKADD